MPETVSGREKILAYLKENHILITDVATLYGIPQPDLSDMLSGKDLSTRAVRTLTRIIGDYKIR